MDARQITRELRGEWYGGYGSAACPVCQPGRQKGQNALTLADGDGGRLLLHCKKSGCDFDDMRAAAGIVPGDYAAPDPSEVAARQAQERADAAKRAAQAHRLWQEAQPISGTLAESYLRGRGIYCPLPETLRFLSACWHPTAKRFPAMLALVDGAIGCAVHRTYLAPHGGKAEVTPDKLMLGRVSGGAIKLAVQGFANVETLDGPRALSLYCLTIAASGERKSACYGPLLDAVRDPELEAATAQRDEMQSWQNAHALYKGELDRTR